jgi:hypothetical protein
MPDRTNPHGLVEVLNGARLVAHITHKRTPLEHIVPQVRCVVHNSKASIGIYIQPQATIYTFDGVVITANGILVLERSLDKTVVPLGQGLEVLDVATID